MQKLQSCMLYESHQLQICENMWAPMYDIIVVFFVVFIPFTVIKFSFFLLWIVMETDEKYISG